MHGCIACPSARARTESTWTCACCWAAAFSFSSVVPLREHTASASTKRAKAKLRKIRSRKSDRRLPQEAPTGAVVVPFAFMQMARTTFVSGVLLDRDVRAAGDRGSRDRAGLHLVRHEEDVRGDLRNVHLARLTSWRDRRDLAATRESRKRSHKHASCNESLHRIIPFVNGLEHPYRGGIVLQLRSRVMQIVPVGTFKDPWQKSFTAELKRAAHHAAALRCFAASAQRWPNEKNGSSVGSPSASSRWRLPRFNSRRATRWGR